MGRGSSKFTSLFLFVVLISGQAFGSLGHPIPSERIPNGVCKIDLLDKFDQPIAHPVTGELFATQSSVCGSVYLGKDYFVTAGHCLFDRNKPYESNSTITARVDTHLVCGGQNYGIDFLKIYAASDVADFGSTLLRKLLYPTAKDLVIFKSKVSLPAEIKPLKILSSISELGGDRDSTLFGFVRTFAIFGYGLGRFAPYGELNGSRITTAMVMNTTATREWGVLQMQIPVVAPGDSGGPLAIEEQNQFTVIGWNSAGCSNRFSCFGFLSWELLRLRFKDIDDTDLHRLLQGEGEL